MLKGLGDLGQIMKLQKEFKNVQKKIQNTKMNGESSDGMVKAMVNGEYKVLEIKINPDFLKNNDTSKIEKMVLSAVNDAIEKVKDYSVTEMGKLTGGLDIPGLGSLLNK